MSPNGNYLEEAKKIIIGWHPGLGANLLIKKMMAALGTGILVFALSTIR